MLIYQHQPDESMTWTKIAFDEDDGWWNGIQKLGATVALAAVLALTGAQTAQAISVSHQPQDEVPSAFDEDFWQNPVAPVYGVNYVAKPFSDTDDAVPQPRPDEDYWNNPVFPALARYAPQPFTDANEFVGYTLDEDFWQNPVSPVAGKLSWPQPFWDQNDFVGYTLDEDYWQNQVAPLVQKTAPQPFSDPNDFIGYTLDEDYLLSLVPRFQPVNIWQQPFDGAEIVPQPVAPIQDEDYWQNAVAPVVAKNLYPSPMWDAAEGVQLVVPPAPTGAHYIPIFRRRRR